jgi:hypothetical protein
MYYPKKVKNFFERTFENPEHHSKEKTISKALHFVQPCSEKFGIYQTKAKFLGICQQKHKSN